MAAAEPIQGLSFFSTDGGLREPRAAGQNKPPTMARSNVKKDADLFIEQLRARWPHECNAIFAPWDIRWFFDEYDFYKYGGQFLYENVLMTMTKQNEENLIRWSQVWSDGHKSHFHLIMDLGVDKVFHEDDHVKYGKAFLQKALEHMRAAYQRALNGELIEANMRQNTMLAIPYAPSNEFLPRIPSIRTDPVQFIGQRRGASGFIPNTPFLGPPMQVQWAPTSQLHGHVPYPGVGAFIPVRTFDGALPDRELLNALPVPPGALFDPHSDSVSRVVSGNRHQHRPSSLANNFNTSHRVGNDYRDLGLDFNTTNRGRKDSAGRGRGYKTGNTSRKSSMSFNDNDGRRQADGSGSMVRRKLDRRPTLDFIRDESELGSANLHSSSQITPKCKPSGGQANRPADIFVPGKDAINTARADNKVPPYHSPLPVELPSGLRVTPDSIGDDVSHVVRLFAGGLSSSIHEWEIESAYRNLPGFDSVSIIHKQDNHSPGKRRFVFIVFKTVDDARRALTECKNRGRYSLQVAKQFWTHDGDGIRFDTAHQFGNPGQTTWSDFYSRVETTSPTKSKKPSNSRNMSMVSRERTRSSGHELYSPQDARSDLWPRPDTSVGPKSPTTKHMSASDVPTQKTNDGATLASSIKKPTTTTTSGPAMQQPEVTPASAVATGASEKVDATKPGEGHHEAAQISDKTAPVRNQATDDSIARADIAKPEGQDKSKLNDARKAPAHSIGCSHNSLARTLKIVPALPRNFKDVSNIKSATITSPAKEARENATEDYNSLSEPLSRSETVQAELEKPLPIIDLHEPHEVAHEVTNGSISTAKVASDPERSERLSAESAPAVGKMIRIHSVENEKQVAQASSIEHTNGSSIRCHDSASNEFQAIHSGRVEDAQGSALTSNHSVENISVNSGTKIVDTNVPSSDDSVLSAYPDTPSDISTPLEASLRHVHVTSKRSHGQWPSSWLGQYEEIRKILSDFAHKNARKWSEEAESIKHSIESLDLQMRNDEARLADQPAKSLGKSLRKRVKKRTDDHAQQSEEMFLLLGRIHNARTAHAESEVSKATGDRRLSLKVDMALRRYPTHEGSASLPYTKPRDGNNQSSFVSRDGLDGSASLRGRSNNAFGPNIVMIGGPRQGGSRFDFPDPGEDRRLMQDQSLDTGGRIEDITEEPKPRSTAKTLSHALTNLFKHEDHSSGGNYAVSEVGGLGIRFPDASQPTGFRSDTNINEVADSSFDQQVDPSLIPLDSSSASSDSTLDDDDHPPKRPRTESDHEVIKTPEESEGPDEVEGPDEGGDDQDDRRSSISYASLPPSPTDVNKAQALFEALVRDSKIQIEPADSDSDNSPVGHDDQSENMTPEPSRPTSTPGQMSYAKAAVNTSIVPGSIAPSNLPTMSPPTLSTLTESTRPSLPRRLSATSQHSTSNLSHYTPKDKGKGRAKSTTDSDSNAAGAGQDAGKSLAGEHFEIAPGGAWFSSPNGPPNPQPPSSWKGMPKRGAHGRKGG